MVTDLQIRDPSHDYTTKKKYRHVCVLANFAQGQSTVDWHFILTDGSSATLLRQEDKNIGELQNILQEFSASGRQTFAFVVTFLTTEICLADNDKSLFSYCYV